VGVKLARQAQAEARARAERDIAAMAAQFGSLTWSRRTRSAGAPDPLAPGWEAVAALEAAHELEQAAHALAGEYVRQAREAGRSWEVIGDALGLLFLASANKIGVGEQAHDYALAYDHRPGPRTYTWPCPACEQTITDHGPYPDVPGQEEGHDPACTRRTAQLAAWEEQRSGH
jgi:hypothetical protein